MTILATILILGGTLTFERSRVVESDRPIAWLTVESLIGVATEVLSDGRPMAVRGSDGLRISGGAHTGGVSEHQASRIPLAVLRVAGFVTDYATDGRVVYRYTVHARGYRIERATRIENDRLTLTTRVTGDLGRYARAATLVIAATQSGGKTTILLRVSVDTDVPLARCRLVRRVADREAGRVLDGILETVESRGRGFVLRGEDVLVGGFRR